MSVYTFQPTPHAIKRWQERFPGRDMAGEFNAAKPAPRKVRTLITKHGLGRRPGTYYVVAPCGAVFVCHQARRGFVVTVLPDPRSKA
ncbi:hypothetical protein [Noviluteimonas gilva]|uniref:Uncharacterized protein n=1 Tax=Noviluteimonas gilva TaxID=2682097 RepID=A0A7C9M0C4_9GAMM|nr:hypothetical protein [Lysobacter gilvus]MUV13548.1 hypothetical protein [Lysobacter gilvus]